MTIDFLHNDFVMRRNGVIEPLVDEGVPREELIQALHESADSKTLRQIKLAFVGIVFILALTAISWLSADPVPFK